MQKTPGNHLTHRSSAEPVSIFSYENFADFFADYINQKKSKNPRISYRWLSRKLGIKSPSYLIAIGKNTRLPSDNVLGKFLKLFRFSDEESAYAKALLGYQRAKNFSEKSTFAVKLAELRSYSQSPSADSEEHATDLGSCQPPLNYRDFLRAELHASDSGDKEALCKFADKVGVSARFLSQVLSEERALSETSARKICRRCSWDVEKCWYFLKLVQYEREKDYQQRQAIHKELAVKNPTAKFYQLDTDVFIAISAWHHGAILELVSCAGFEASPQWIARRLRIPEIKAEVALDRLLRLGMLVQTAEGLAKSAPHFQMKDVPLSALRNAHTEFLKMAADEYTKQGFEERDYTASTMAIDPDKIPEFKRKIRDFRRELIEFANEGSAKQIYQLCVQFFRLDRG